MGSLCAILMHRSTRHQQAGPGSQSLTGARFAVTAHKVSGVKFCLHLAELRVYIGEYQCAIGLLRQRRKRDDIQRRDLPGSPNARVAVAPLPVLNLPRVALCLIPVLIDDDP